MYTSMPPAAQIYIYIYFLQISLDRVFTILKLLAESSHGRQKVDSLAVRAIEYAGDEVQNLNRELLVISLANKLLQERAPEFDKVEQFLVQLSNSC